MQQSQEMMKQVELFNNQKLKQIDLDSDEDEECLIENYKEIEKMLKK